MERRELLSGLSVAASTFSVSQFETNLREQVGIDPNPLLNDTTPNVVGLTYSIDQRNSAGTVLDHREDGLGFARMFWDTPQNPGIPGLQSVAASSDARQEVASISKAITGAAIMHLLQEQTSSIEELNSQLSLPAAAFLPSNWSKSAFFQSITSRQLLTHNSGIRSASLGNAGAYTYNSLRSISAQLSLNTPPPGFVWFQAFPKVTSYHTTNFAYFRVMLPYMWNEVSNNELNSNAVTNLLDISELSSDEDLAEALGAAIMEDWNIAPIGGTDILGVTPDRVTASIYKYYVSTYILEPAGILNPQTRTTGQPFNTLLYPINPFVLPGSDLYAPVVPLLVPGVDTNDRTLEAGSRGWNLNVHEMTDFLAAIRYDDTILNAQTRQLMDDQLLGWMNSSNFTGDFGDYLGHDGLNFRPSLPAWAPTNAPNLDARNNTIAMVFPNNVQASMFINSQIRSDDNSVYQIGAAFDPAGTGKNMAVTMREAWDNAWTDLVYRGDTFGDGPLDHDDIFEVRLNAANPAFLDFRHDGQTIFTRRIDTLQSLTILGLAGDDTLFPDDLPASLTVHFNGGAGDDTAFVGRGQSLSAGDGDLDRIQGAFTFDGGTSINGDTLVVDDTADVYLGTATSPNQKVRTYQVNSFDVRRSGIGIVANYSNVESVVLNSSSQPNLILMRSIASGTDVVVNAGIGSDRIVLGNANASANINGNVVVNPGGGDDEMIIDDRNGTVADDFYVFQENYFVSSVIPVIAWDTDAPPERIVLQGSNQNSTTNIQGVLDGVRLIVHGRGGNDAINLHAVSPGGQVNLIAGAGNDTISLTPTGRDLDTIQGLVFATGESGTFDQIILHDENNSDNGRNYRFTNNRFDIVGSPFDQLIYTGSVETLELQAGNDDDLFDVRSTSVSTLVSLFGNAGSDTLNVAGSSQDLDSIDGSLYFSGGSGDGTDLVVLHDEQDTGNDTYSLNTDPPSTVTKPGFQFNHFGVEELTLNANGFNNWIVMGGTFAVQTTDYTINTGDGRDTVTVNASAPMVVTVNGGAGTPDHVRVFGTAQDDTVTLRSDRVELGATTVVFGSGIERRSLDTGAGLDVLIAEGQEGIDERFIVRSSTVPAQVP